MKKYFWLPALLGLGISTLSSCTVDANGNPAMTPAGAVAVGLGALAAGAAIESAVDNHHQRHPGPNRWNSPPPPLPPGWSPH